MNCTATAPQDKRLHEGNWQMLLSISQFADLTAFDRRTITKSLKDLRSIDGEHGALLYESSEALPVLFKTDSLEAARAEQARTAAQLNAIRADVLRKTRIPIATVLQAHDEILQAIAATLKPAKGKLLTQDLINDIFDKFRSIPAKLKW